MSTIMRSPGNFRDVGSMVNRLVTGKVPILVENTLYRGGRIIEGASMPSIGEPRTLVNLTQGPEPSSFMLASPFYKCGDGHRYHSCPMSNSVDTYNICAERQWKWVYRVMEILADPANKPPFYVHCAFGRDRTGVIIGVLLTELGISTNVILAEFMLTGSARDSLPRFRVMLGSIESAKKLHGLLPTAALRERFLANP